MPRLLPYPPGARCDGFQDIMGDEKSIKILTRLFSPNIGEHHPIPNHTSYAFLVKTNKKKVLYIAHVEEENHLRNDSNFHCLCYLS